jgi:ribosome-associated heat shock protein Hsp15
MSEESVRLDKWLWAARFFKTRSLAADAVDSGKVKLNGERTKPAKAPKLGDRLEIRAGQFAFVVTVSGLNDRRGSATIAHQLYVESEESKAAREQLRGELRANAAAGIFYKGRPTKKVRRQIEGWRQRGEE